MARATTPRPRTLRPAQRRARLWNLIDRYASARKDYTIYEADATEGPRAARRVAAAERALERAIDRLIPDRGI